MGVNLVDMNDQLKLELLLKIYFNTVTGCPSYHRHSRLLCLYGNEYQKPGKTSDGPSRKRKKVTERRDGKHNGNR